jgi:hypothetical protein
MLKCHNDGKERSQSFEVWDDSEALDSVQRGYGKDEEEAYHEYLINVREFIKQVTNSYHLVIVNKSSIKMVDCTGEPIKNRR